MKVLLMSPDIIKFILALESSDFETIKELHRSGIDIHFDDDRALKEASRNGDLDIVRYLCENGVQIQDFSTSIALSGASREGHLHIVKYLLEKGAIIRDSYDGALHMACKFGHLDIVKCLCENGSDINSYEDRALKYAARHNHLDIVIYLLQHGANISFTPSVIYFSKKNDEYIMIYQNSEITLDQKIQSELLSFENKITKTKKSN